MKMITQLDKLTTGTDVIRPRTAGETLGCTVANATASSSGNASAYVWAGISTKAMRVPAFHGRWPLSSTP